MIRPRVVKKQLKIMAGPSKNIVRWKIVLPRTQVILPSKKELFDSQNVKGASISGHGKNESPKTYPRHAFLARWRSRCLDRSLWMPLWPSLCLAVRTLRVFIGISLGLTVSSKVAKCCLCMANLHEDLVTHCTCVVVFSLCWVLNFWQVNK